METSQLHRLVWPPACFQMRACSAIQLTTSWHRWSAATRFADPSYVGVAGQGLPRGLDPTARRQLYVHHHDVGPASFRLMAPENRTMTP